MMMQPMDRRRLELSIPSTAHKGLRILCTNEVLNIDVNCPVNTTAGEIACVRVSNIRLDIKKIQELVEPIIRKLVNPPHDDGYFDHIAKPLAELDKRLPGISDLRKQKTTLLDIAETYEGSQTGVRAVRTILGIW
jgi:hypothetical protein